MYLHEKIGDLDKYLQDIEERMDEQEEEMIWNHWLNYANEGVDFNKPYPSRKPKTSKIDWPDVKINEALEDETLMLYTVYRGVSKNLENPTVRLHNIRPNYGVGILPNAFANVEYFVMDAEQNMLPNVRSVKGGTQEIERLASEPIPNVYSNVGKKVFSIGKKFMEIAKRYPKIAKYVKIDHPDCQGPMDVCELLWGSDIFFELYESEELAHALLRKVTDFYKAFLDEWFKIVPNDICYHSFYGKLVKGRILVRDDSATNLSPDFFRQFILPYDEEVLLHFGGGAIHFCGKGDHFIPIFKEIKGLNGVDMSQPHLNDVDLVLSNTVDVGIRLSTADMDCVFEKKDSNHNMNLVSAVPN